MVDAVPHRGHRMPPAHGAPITFFCFPWPKRKQRIKLFSSVPSRSLFIFSSRVFPILAVSIRDTSPKRRDEADYIFVFFSQSNFHQRDKYLKIV